MKRKTSVDITLLDIEKKIEQHNLEKMSDMESRSRNESLSYQSMNEEDLLTMLKETKSLHDEADILHCLFLMK